MASAPRNDIFATTRWSVVLNARDADAPLAAEALTELCRTYWFPLYAYIRGRGFSAHDAEDLTQGFFAKLLRLESIAKVSPEKGRFRAFLLASVKNFLAAEARYALAEKRNAKMTISLDAQAAETRYAMEPSDAMTPEAVFERQWAL
ncbi:MAG: DNA-directed RNA polymerase specialized sigma24 family protein, partial [Verrucomicrobiales bacterium]